MVSNTGALFLTIIDTIEEFVGPYVDMVTDFLDGIPVWTQALAILALAIFTLIGLFVFIKKFIKVFLVLAVLGAIGYFLWTQGIIQNLIGNLTGFIL